MAKLEDVEPLIEKWAPVIRKAFMDAIYAMRDRVVISDIVAALQRGDVNAALRAVGLEGPAFTGVDSAITQAFQAGGQAVAGSVPVTRDGDGHRVEVLFDVRNQSAEAWLRNHSSTLVREIVEDQKVAIKAHLEAGMAAGTNPRTVALDLVGRVNPETKRREGGVLGLTSTQDKWVRAYADELAKNDHNALQRKLRDKRFDRTVKAAIATGQPLSPEQQSKMVAAYRIKALKHRAEMLARTEAMTALNQSAMEAVEQTINKGAAGERHVSKIWRSAGDKRVRHTHRFMNGQKVPFRGRFTSDSGATLRYPGDPEAPAAERVGCRCWQEIVVDFIAMEIGK